MRKGLFTQGVSLLTNGKTTLGDVKSALTQQKFEIVKEVTSEEPPALVVSFLPEVNGYMVLDVANRPWPDSMGDPQSDPKTMAEWSMGHFGPFAFPGSLARAGQHAWTWGPGRTISEGHGGYIRLKISYVLGADDDAFVLPTEYEPISEMLFLSLSVIALLQAPGVICYFNPNGEVLRDRAAFHQVWDASTKQQETPLPLWMNIRFFKLNDQLAFMDTVGNGQLDIPDVEAIFPLAKYDPKQVDGYLRGVTEYLLGFDGEMRSGEAIDGPGENHLSWTTEMIAQGLVDPPRRVLRLYPKASVKLIRKALSAARQ